MSLPGRPKGEYRSAQHEAGPVIADAAATAEREAHRARYEALRAQGQGATATALPPPSPRGLPLDEAAVLHRETVPGGWYCTLRVARGEAVRIATPSGTSAVSLLAWSTDDPSERLNTADTIKVQWSACLRKGRVLFTDMGRVALSIVEDSCGAHDVLAGPTTAASMQAALGPGAWRHSRDNFVAAAAKLGLSRRDIPPCITLFAPVSVDEGGRLAWHAGRRQPGDFVDLRAEMDLWVVLSNAGHPLDPALLAEPAPVEVALHRPPPPVAGDPRHEPGPELARAYDFTDRHARRPAA